MDIAGGVPKVRQSLPNKEVIGDLAPLMQSVMCHIGHCHAPVPCGCDVFAPWAHGCGHRAQSRRARLISSIGV